MFVQKITTLHKGNRVGVHFRDIVLIFVRQTDEAMGDAQLVLSHYLYATLFQQFVIVQQTACDGVLYGAETYHVAVVLDGIEYLLKGRAT